MAERRVIYLAALCGCLVFYWAYREWLSGFLLLLVLMLPWLSLILSLPAMLGCRVEIRCPEAVSINQPAFAVYVGATVFPVPVLKGNLIANRIPTGESWSLGSTGDLPTEHCGALEIQPKRIWVYDYLGLFRIRIKKKENARVLVRPKPVSVDNPPDMSRYLANAWKPKPGGGYAENHELRLYRPGDQLQQIHWKLSAKTGKLILREPMEAVRGVAVLTMELRGSPAELDKKLGKLQWMSDYLLQKEVPHQIHCLTRQGIEVFSVSDETQLHKAIDLLLCARPATEDKLPDTIRAAWRYHIGGDSHET
jgi:uncharacterized protein (DUF58 family)